MIFCFLLLLTVGVSLGTYILLQVTSRAPTHHLAGELQSPRGSPFIPRMGDPDEGMFYGTTSPLGLSDPDRIADLQSRYCYVTLPDPNGIDTGMDGGFGYHTESVRGVDAMFGEDR